MYSGERGFLVGLTVELVHGSKEWRSNDSRPGQGRQRPSPILRRIAHVRLWGMLGWSVVPASLAVETWEHP